MPIDDIQQFIEKLEKAGELKRVKTEVSKNTTLFMTTVMGAGFDVGFGSGFGIEFRLCGSQTVACGGLWLADCRVECCLPANRHARVHANRTNACGEARHCPQRLQ